MKRLIIIKILGSNPPSPDLIQMVHEKGKKTFLTARWPEHSDSITLMKSFLTRLDRNKGESKTAHEVDETRRMVQMKVSVTLIKREQNLINKGRKDVIHEEVKEWRRQCCCC